MRIEEVIEFLDKTEKRIVPFKVSEIAYALREASERNPLLIDGLLQSFINSSIRLNPSSPRHEMINSAYDNLATLAYIADYNPNPLDFEMNGVVKAYRDPKKHGKTMDLVRDVFKERGIDIASGILWGEKISVCVN